MEFRRKSIRLRGYDYSQEGLYFITICTQNKECLFGNIVDGEMVLNDVGRIVENELLKTEEIRKNIKIYEYVVMPNHIHFIIEIVKSVGAMALPRPKGKIDKTKYLQKGCATGNTPTFKLHGNTIGSIVGQIKSITSKKSGIKLRQRNFYEHIIRDEKGYYFIAEYINNNPINWIDDKYFK